VGFRGIAKKVKLFYVVAVAHLYDQAVSVNQVIISAVIYFYIAHELLSMTLINMGMQMYRNSKQQNLMIFLERWEQLF
jgi:phage-related holin